MVEGGDMVCGVYEIWLLIRVRWGVYGNSAVLLEVRDRVPLAIHERRTHHRRPFVRAGSTQPASQ